MRKLLIVALGLALAGSGCTHVSHNAAIFGFGKVAKAGNIEYGEVCYVNGVLVVDVSRENSSWEIEIDDEAGMSYDPDTKTLKGVKKIKRTIGHQATGYLNEIAGKDNDTARAAVEYLRGE